MTQLVWRRRSRASLMRGTALQAAALAVLASPAAAQLSAGARPTGGQVSAGQARISDTASKTLITQSSQNAAINWQSYNVGSGQTVQYVQPNAASMTLNRVIGANPSQIAGHILANGQIVLINQSGVVFSKGAQVDTAGLVVSTAGMTDKNFMAGHLVFDQAGHPGAAISNAGNITISQAGLAALVAPQVANSGTITARLGRVILGGAETHTLDLYGDGLVALNVTGQVTKASLGGKQVTALVTNSGTILAPGGTVVLTAAAVDGVVTNLVEAGGTVAAPTLGGQTGRVLVQGIGGGISIDGSVSATGVAAGTKGGQVVANATGAVRVGPGANVDASGDSGGGVIAIGTTAARAIGGASVTPTLVAQSVNLQAGARISANAKRRGAGGRIAVLSRNATTQSGNISATGGASGGAGGWIEVSGGKVGFGGLLNVGAAQGKAGSILIDPEDLDIGGPAQNPQGTTTFLGATQFAAFIGNVILKADGVLTITGNVSTSPLATSLQLEGDSGIAINALLNAGALSVGLKTLTGAITEGANGGITAGSLSATAGGAISLGGANKIGDVGIFDNTTSPQLLLSGLVVSNNAGTVFSGGPTTSDEIKVAGLSAGGDVTIKDAAALTVQTGAPIAADGGNVAISITGTNGLGNLAAPNGLTVQDNITGANVTLSTAGTVTPTGLGATPYAGTVFSQTAGTIAAVGGINGNTPVGGTLTISAAMGALSIGGELLTLAPIVQGVPPVPQGATTLTALAGNIVEQIGSSNAGTGSILTGSLSGSSHNNGTGTGAPAGDANFAIAAGNRISTLTGFTSTGSFALENDTQLVVNTLQAGSTIALNGPTTSADPTGILVLEGAVSASGNISLSNALGIAELTGASVASTNGSVGLSTAGAIVQQARSSLTGGEASTVGRGISLSAAGSTDFSSYLGTPSLGSVSGLSLGGTVTAGALGSGGYSGSASLTAGNGDILEPSGSIRTGTLIGSASGSGTSGVLPNGDVLLSVSSGNSISSIGSFSATGSLVVESDAGLAIGTLSAGPTLSLFGPAGNVFPTGVLTLVGPITATGGISFSNATGIGVLGSAVIDSTTAGVSMVSRSGAIALQTGASVTGGEDAATGTAIALDAGGSTVFLNALGSVHGISLGGTLTAGAFVSPAGTYSGSTSLIAAAGDITEGTGGSILTGNLSGSATTAAESTGSATLSAGPGNTVGTLTAFSTSGSFTLEDDAGLTVENIKAGGGISITGPANPGGDLLLTGTITAGGAALFSNALGVAELVGASVTDPSGGITLFSAGGAVVQQAGATESGAVASLSGASVALVAGGSTTFGSATGLGTVAGITFGGAITGGTLRAGAYSGSATFSATHGDILEGSAATLLAGTVSALASGALQLDVTSGNVIGTISGFAHGGDVVLEDDSGLVIGNLAASGSLSVLEPSGVAQTGVLIIAGTVTAPGSISLANKLGIGELTNASVSSATSTVSLTTAGAISQQGTSSITADSATGSGTASGTLLVLSAGGSTDFNTYVPADDLGTVHGISFAGTLTSGTLAGSLYSGLINLTASAGDILEGGTGSLGADMLVGGATAGGTASGNAEFLSVSGNSIGTLANFPVTGSFALEDNTGLLVLGQTAGGSIDIHGPTDPTGILILDGAIQAPGNINLSNAVGVADLSGTTITSTSGGVTLSSGSGAVFEQVDAAIASGATTGTTSAITLFAGGSTDFGNFALTSAIGTIHGLEFDGAVTAGSLSAGAYTGSASLVATHGDIVEGGNASLLVGSLSANATGLGAQSAGNVMLDITSGNSIAAIGGSSATGNVAIEDDTGLALGALAAGGSIFVHDPAAGATGILVIGGAVSAGSSITLANALGIAELPAGRVTSADAAVSLDSRDGAILQQANGSIAGGTAAGTGTLLVLTAGGSTNFSAYGLTAPTVPVSGISFAGTLAAGQLANGLYSGTASLVASIGNISEAGTGSVRAATLAGSATGGGGIAGEALFTAATGNVVSTLSAFGVTGNFALEDDAGLTVLGQTSGGSIDIHGPTNGGTQTGILVINGVITAPGQITLDNDFGIAELAGASVTSTGAGITITSGHGAFAQQTLSSMSASGAQPLSITANGTTNFAALLPASGLGSVSGISFGGTLSAGPSSVATLSTSSGNISEGAQGSLRAGTLNGSTTGTASFNVSSGNSISAIGSLSAPGDIVLEDDAGLTIGTVIAGGLVNIFGPSAGLPGGILTLAGTLTGSSVSLSNAQGISLGGTLTAGTLSGAVYTGVATLVSNNGSISEPGGVVRAGTLSGHADGAAVFDVASGNVVSTFTSFSTGGDLTLEDDIGPLVGVLSAGGNIDIFTPGAGTTSGILQITGQSTATGNISLSNRFGILEESGASLTTTHGSITLTSSSGAIAQLAGGTLAGGTALTLDAGGSTNFNTYVQLPSPLEVQGISFAGKMTAGSLAGTLYSGVLDFIASAGNIVELPTGVVQAGTLSATAQSSLPSIAGSILLGSVGSATGGNQVAALGASTADAGFSFVDGQALSVIGAVQAGSTALARTGLQIVAPAINVTSGSLKLSPPDGVLPGVIDLVADHFTFGTPGAVNTPGGVVALDLLNANGAGTIFSVGSAPGDTVSAASLANIQSQHGTLAIGSLDGTVASPENTVSGSWALGAGGTVTAIDFSAPVNLGGESAPSALGLFSDDVITVSNGVTVASLYGSAGGASATTGTASFLGSNAIGTLGVVNDAGQLVGFLTERAGASGSALQFQLADSAPLLVLGPVSAGQGAVSIAVSGAGNALTIGGTNTAGTTTLTGGQITGTDISLAATGNISQLTGTLNAFGAAGATNGTIAIASSGGSVTLDSIVTSGTIGSTQSALLLAAGGGDITEGANTVLTAGTLAALASGNIVLGGNANTFATVGALTSVSDGITLVGLTASGAGGILLRDTGSLLVADQTSVTAAAGSITLSLATGSLTLGSTNGATVQALGPVSLTAPGAIIQNGGTVSSAGAGVALTSQNGSIAQNFGAIAAGGGDVQITAPAGVFQTRSSIDASYDARISSNAGSFTQVSSTILGTHGVVLDMFGAISSTGRGTIASAGIAGDSTSGTVILDSRNGGISFDGTIEGAGQNDVLGFFTPNAASAVLLSASAGDITEAATGVVNAGTLAAFASGNIDLPGNNGIANIGSLSAAAPSLTLTGLFAGGSAGIALTDSLSLNILGNSTAPVIQATSSGATLSIDETQAVVDGLNTTYGTLSLGAFGASTLLADGAITLHSSGSITQGAGLVQSAHGALSLSTNIGDVSQAGGTLAAPNGRVSITAGGNVDQTLGSVIEGGGDVAIQGGGSFNQSQSSILGSHGVALNFGGTITSVQSTIASAGIAGDATSGTVAIASIGSMTLESLLSAGPSGAVLLSSQGDISQVSADGSIAGTIVAPDLAAGAGGNLSLNGSNQVGTIAAIGGLTGLSAGTGSIYFVDRTSLTFAPGSAITSLAGSILVQVLASNTVTPPGTPENLFSNGATVHAGNSVGLEVGGSITQTGGLFQSDQASVFLVADSFTQTGGARVLAGTEVAINGSGAVQQSADSLIFGGQTINFVVGSADLAGTLQAGTLSGGIYSGAIGLIAGGDIEAKTATLLTGTLAAEAGGNIDLSGPANQIASIGPTGSLSGLQGGTITVQDAQSLLVGGNVTGSTVSFSVPTASFTELPGISITSTPGPLSISAGGAVVIGGALSAAGDASLSAGTDLFESAGATIQTGPGNLLTMSAAGTVTLDGLVTAGGPLTITSGSFVEDATASVTAGATSISATSGPATINGVLIATGLLNVQAGADFTEGQTGLITGAGLTLASTAGNATIGGKVQSSGGFLIAADGDVTVASGASIAGDVSFVANAHGPLIPASGGTITAGADATFDGTVTDPLSLTFNAGDAFTLGGTASGGQVSIKAITGAITIDGALSATGDLTASAGTGLALAQTAAVTGGISSITAGGAASVDGSLKATGALSITAGSGFTESASGVVSGGPITLSSTGGAVTIDGAFTSGAALTILADTDFSEGAGAVLSGVPLSVTAKTGAASIDGLFTSFGAFILDAGTNITQGDASTINDTKLAAGGLTSILAAPGTITLGGTLSASSLQIGDIVTKPSGQQTKSIIWNNNVVRTGSNVSIHGATKSISIPAPLTPGHGALGVYLDTASFQQTGTSTVSAIPGTGSAATMQVTIEGRGTAKFNSLVAPDTQLLLVLEQGGTAGGLIDVAGLNIYYTTGIVPVAPVSLHGIVGGLGGFAAATVGFSHHLPNVDYQINSCPIQSINCILLSPLLVPIVDPVNDYAEGTQRKRHQDDDALPNVGEEDY